ncbi:MAG: hypothetical protein JWM53_5869 [bacterium]|nr:hypothetical protein [bacterium]
MTRFVCIEMAPDASDNRPLGLTGQFLHGTFGEYDIARFATREAAQTAGERATNRRDGCTLWINGGKRDPNQLEHPRDRNLKAVAS